MFDLRDPTVVQPAMGFNYLSFQGKSGYVKLAALEPLYDYMPLLRGMLGYPAKIPGWPSLALPEPTVRDTASVYALAIGLAHQDEARRVKFRK